MFRFSTACAALLVAASIASAQNASTPNAAPRPTQPERIFEIVPVELPPLDVLPDAGPQEVAVRLRIAGYTVRHPGQLWFVVNGDAYEVGDAVLKFPEDKDVRKPLWSGSLKPGEIKTLRVDACAHDTNPKLFAGTGRTKLNGFTVIVSNINGKTTAQWKAAEGTKEQEIFTGPTKPRTTPSFMQYRKRYKLADDGIIFLGDFVIDSTDSAKPTPAQMEQMRIDSGATEGKLDPTKGLGKRVTDFAEQNKDILEKRKKALEKFKQDQERLKKKAELPRGPIDAQFASLNFVMFQERSAPEVSKQLDPVVPKSNSEEIKGLLEKAIRLVLKDKLPSWASALWKMTSDPVRTGLGVEHVGDDALTKEINIAFRKAEFEAKTMKLAVNAFKSKLSDEIAQKSKDFKERRGKLDAAEVEGQAWAIRRGKELEVASNDFNRKAAKTNAPSGGPPEPTAADYAQVAALDRSLE